MRLPAPAAGNTPGGYAYLEAVMFIPGQAGYSALRQAVRLLWKQVIDVVIWGSGGVSAGVVAFMLAPGSLSVVSLAAGAVAGATLGTWRWRKPSQWRSWLQGALAEHRTGRILNRLRRAGWGVLHDRRKRGSRANWDHVIVLPDGKRLAYVDTKAWHAKKALIRVDRGRLMYGPWSQATKVETVAWEASELYQATGIPTLAIIAVDGGKVDGGHVVFRGVHVIEVDLLLGFLGSLDQTLIPQRDAMNRAVSNIRRDFVVAR